MHGLVMFRGFEILNEHSIFIQFILLEFIGIYNSCLFEKVRGIMVHE
jgi:hypothetical protein